MVPMSCSEPGSVVTIRYMDSLNQLVELLKAGWPRSDFAGHSTKVRN